jgi:anti-sigma-K factor RskA
MRVVAQLDDMSCGELADAAAEFALGALTGRERARAVAHLESCDACQEKVHRLAVTSDDLLGLLPDREPPPGFWMRVLARAGLASTAPVRRRGRRSGGRRGG